MSIDYTLYGADHSYYTGKVRSYLIWKELSYRELPATREVYKSFILPRVGAAIVPVLHTADDEVVQDSTDIIDFLESRHPNSSVYPAGPRQRLVALLLEQFGDEWLLLPAMHYRWSVLDHQYDFIMREFGRLSDPDATLEEQLRLGEEVSRPFRGSITALGINDATADGIEQCYLGMLDQLNSHFTRYPYLLGDQPSIGDFGLIGPLYAHLGRDPVPARLMQERAPAVWDWVQRMNQPGTGKGDFLPDDEIPETLVPLLQTLARDFLPDVASVIARTAAWCAEHPGQDVPRYLGKHAFQFGAARGERIVPSFSQWMFQRAWLHYHGLGALEREPVDELLARIGGEDVFSQAIPQWLERVPGQLELRPVNQPQV